MNPTSTPQFKCRVCGKHSTGKIPRGGDGSFRFPRWHKSTHGSPCPGVFEEAEWVAPLGKSRVEGHP